MADGNSGLGGLRMVLGGNPFGWTIDRDASFAVLDAFYEAGGRSVDTAEIYSVWVSGNKGGESETIIGEWLVSRSVRADMRIASKTGMGGPPGGLAREKVSAACVASLDRLQTDYLDLYYVHRDDESTPVDEVVSCYNALIDAGKVRVLGASNISTARLAAMNADANARELVPFTVIQPGYNLVWRNEYPADLEALALRDGLDAVPYYSLASGFLTGKYAGDDYFVGMRGGSAQRFANPLGWAALPVVKAIADECDATMGQIALAWIAARPAIWAPLASATSPGQVDELIAANKLSLSDDQTARLNAVSIDC